MYDVIGFDTAKPVGQETESVQCSYIYVSSVF